MKKIYKAAMEVAAMAETREQLEKLFASYIETAFSQKVVPKRKLICSDAVAFSVVNEEKHRNWLRSVVDLNINVPSVITELHSKFPITKFMDNGISIAATYQQDARQHQLELQKSINDVEDIENRIIRIASPVWEVSVGSDGVLSDQEKARIEKETNIHGFVIIVFDMNDFFYELSEWHELGHTLSSSTAAQLFDVPDLNSALIGVKEDAEKRAAKEEQEGHI